MYNFVKTTAEANLCNSKATCVAFTFLSVNFNIVRHNSPSCLPSCQDIFATRFCRNQPVENRCFLTSDVTCDQLSRPFSLHCASFQHMKNESLEFTEFIQVYKQEHLLQDVYGSEEPWWDFRTTMTSGQSVPTTFVGLCLCLNPLCPHHPLQHYCIPPSQCSQTQPGAPDAVCGPWPPGEVLWGWVRACLSGGFLPSERSVCIPP